MQRFLAILIVCTAADAAAGPVVLQVDKTTVLVDVGAEDGVAAGSVLELLHAVTVTDPVTKETLRDVFPLGTLTVIRAGDGVAEASPEEAIAGRVKVGDAVRFVSDRQVVVDAWKERVTASKTPKPKPRRDTKTVDHHDDGAAARAAAERDVADAAAVHAVWQATLGKPIADRIDQWSALILADPYNTYASDVSDEVASLRAQQAALEAAAKRPAPDRATDRAFALGQLDARARTGVLGDAAVTQARAGEPVALAFAVLQPVYVAQAWLYVQRPGTDTFDRLDMTLDGDGYVRGEIPAASVVAPGVDWFVEVAPRAGQPTAVLGEPTAPRHLEVADVVEPAPAPRGRSRVTLALDYVDFDGGLSDGYDQYRQAEIDFMYRFNRPVYAFRLGFGTLSGTGGPKDTIDEDPTDSCMGPNGFECEDVSYTYGYVEAELRIKPSVAVMIRPQVGKFVESRTDGTDTGECLSGDLASGCSVDKGFGLRGRVRLGLEDATNLVLGVGFTENVGTLAEAAYTWAASPQIPVVLQVQVTDLPVQENLGVRIVCDVGFRKLPWVYPSLRVSYQARDVDHAGFSGGLGMNFDW